MNGSVLLDVFLVLLLLTFLIYGYGSGFLRSLGGILGFVAGGIAAFFLVPLVGTWVTDPGWRGPAMLASGVLLVGGGLSVGLSIGYAIRRTVARGPLRAIDRVLGAALTFVATALTTSVLAFSVGSLGVPFLSPAIGSSVVIRTIDSLTPVGAKAFIAQARGAVLDNGLPQIVDAFQADPPELPAEAPENADLAQAALSVVRITGTAYSCGQNQSGSGFVAAADRVVTNAHVVAGVVEPVVQTPAGQALPGRVVYFDPIGDLAVIRVSGLTDAALASTGDLAAGAPAVTFGYPFGGPFDADPAVVISVDTQLVANIYGESPAPRRIYTLAADVQQGESGGPLLSEQGRLAGVVFARGATTDNAGYAIAMDSVQPVIDQAAQLVEPVSSGSCAGA